MSSASSHESDMKQDVVLLQQSDLLWGKMSVFI